MRSPPALPRSSGAATSAAPRVLSLTRWFPAVLALACGPSAPPAVPGDGSTCSTDPPGPPAQSLLPIQSHLGAEVVVEEKRLIAELERQVPKTLASARNQSIGVAGRVTYRITRSGFTITPTERELVVSTQLDGAIDVCKPLGPFCPGYGSCSPRWNVEVTIPTVFDEDLSLRARSDVSVSSGCVLRPVGYNATPELQRITDTESRKVQSQIRRELRRIEEQVGEAWERLAKPRPLPNGSCLVLDVKDVAYAPIERRGTDLRTAAEARGTLRVSCTQTDDDASGAEDGGDGDSASPNVGTSRGAPVDATRAPTIHRETKLDPSIDVALGSSLSYARLSSELGGGDHVRLRAVGAGEQPPHVNGDNSSDASERTVDDTAEMPSLNVLYLAFEPEGSCSIWVRVQPRVEKGRLRFVVAGPSHVSPELRGRIERLALARPDEVGALRTALEDLLGQIDVAKQNAASENVAVNLENNFTESIRVGPGGLEWVLRVTGRAVARASSHH